MPQSLPEWAADQLARLEARIAHLERAPRLTNSSIDDGSINVKDEDERVREVIGRQSDGSHGSRVVLSPDQPTPTAPVLPVPVEDEPVSSVFVVRWDGETTDFDVPLVHGHTEVWGQRLTGEDVADVEQAALMGTIRDRAGGATTVSVGGRQGTWVFWLRLVGQDRVTKGEFSDPSTVTVTALVDAQDIEDRLNEFADGGLPDGAYANLLVRLGEFMQIRADQIDVNSLAADGAFIGLLETAGIVLSDEAAGRRTEVSGQGLSITDTTTEQPIMQLGLYGDDFFSLTDEVGGQSVMLNRNGLVAGRTVSADEEFMAMGKPLLGTLASFPGMAELNSILEGLPRGIHAQLRRPFTESSTPASEVTFAYGQARLEGGRLYRLSIPPFALGSTSTDADMVVYQTTSTSGWPGMPSSASMSLGQQAGRTASGEFPLMSYERIIRPDENGFYRWIFVLRRKSGTSISFLNFSRGTAHIMLEDIGRDINNTGRFLFRPASTTTEVGTAEATRLAVVPSSGVTYGSTNGSATSFPTQTTGDTRYRIGYWDIASVSNMNYVTACKFPDQTATVGAREVISAAYRVQVDAWVNPTIADTIRPGFRVNSSELPSSLPASSITWLGNLSGVRARRWVTIPIPQERIDDAVAGNLQLVLGQPSTWRTTGAAVATNQVELELRLSTE